jgi:hypothetical protein
MSRILNPLQNRPFKGLHRTHRLSMILAFVLISAFFKPFTVPPAFAEGADNPQYILRLHAFSISNTMARHTDTDWVYFTVRIGDTTFPTRYAKIGDLNNGDYTLDWDFGPSPVKPNDLVIITYQIVNSGHGSAQDAVDIANATQGAVATIASGIVPPAAPIIGIISGALAVVGGILHLVFANCDGIVLNDAVTGNGQNLNDWTHDTGSHAETRSYTGPETPTGCGSNAQYTVTWSIIRATPIVTCNAADGLWHATDVTISCIVSSSGGTALEPDSTISLSTHIPDGTETADAVTETRSICDAAGKCATAGSVNGIKIDKKPPTIAIETSNVPTPTWTVVTSDSGSGINPASIVISFDGINYQPYVVPIPIADHASLYARVLDQVGNIAVANPVHTVLDSFNQPDGALDIPWSGHLKTGDYQITNDQLHVRVGDRGTLYWQRTSFGVAQEATITLAHIDTTSHGEGSRQGLLLKVQGEVPDIQNGAIEVRYYALEQKTRIITYTPGQSSQRIVEIPAVFADGDQLGAQALADGRVQVYRNRQLIGEADAGSFFAGIGGHIGLRCIDNDDTILDDFGGGTLTTAQ